jgi:hypothetical protein
MRDAGVRLGAGQVSGRSTRPNVSKRPRGSIPWQKLETLRLCADLEAPEDRSKHAG